MASWAVLIKFWNECKCILVNTYNANDIDTDESDGGKDDDNPDDDKEDDNDNDNSLIIRVIITITSKNNKKNGDHENLWKEWQ